jgi:hypothetical protein
MARPSRPPGFDMTYRPERRVAFGPPLRQQAFSLGYFAFALLISAVIIYGQRFAPSGSRVFEYVVEGDRHRLISSSVCATILFSSALAAVLREQMRGVVLHPEGIELRELLSFGWPRVRRYQWAQIDRVFVPSASVPIDPKAIVKTIRLDLWDGSRTWLPDVAKASELGMLLERVALARAIPIEGGTGLVDDLGNPLTGD